MKQFIFIFSLCFFLMPQFVSAGYEFVSPNQPLRISFTEDWRQFTDEGVLNLPNKEREHLQTAFFTTDKETFLYVKRYPTTHANWSTFKNAKEYHAGTPADLFKEERIKNPIETLIGKKISDFHYDFEHETLRFESKKITSANTSYKIYGFWKHYEDSSLELQFVTYDLSKENQTRIKQMISTLRFDSQVAQNPIPQEDHEKVFQGVKKEVSATDAFLAFVLTKSFLYYFISIILFVGILLLVYRLFSRN